jgi:MGT family glycosyltransferase
MARVVFWGIPAHGHINPTVPLVTELVHRGEQVFYYALEAFRPEIERTGAIFRDYGDGFPLSQNLAGALDPASVAYGLALTTQWVLDRYLDEVQALGPDYLIFDAMCPWGPLSAQVLAVPTVCSQAGLFLTFKTLFTLSPKATAKLLWTMLSAPRRIRRCQRILKQVSQRYQCKRLHPLDLFANRGMLNISYTSTLFQPDATAFDPARYKFVGPALLPRPEAPTFPFAALDARKPLLYISLGTAFTSRPDFFRTCCEAFGQSDWQVVMAVGSLLSRETLGPIPDNVLVQAFVPQLEILPRATLFITHGGMNSVNEALSYDVPMVVVPQGADQAWVAKRVETLGAGVSLSSRHMNAAHLHRVAGRVASQPAYAQAAAKVGESLRTAGGYRRAASEILAFTRGQVDMPFVPEST